MFGYIYPNKMELKVKDYYHFKGYYCGLCKSLKKNFGHVSRLSLNYDVTFLAIILSSVYADDESVTYERCVASPFNKLKIIHNKYIDYCSNMNVLLTYYKLIDDWHDDKSVPALTASKAFYFAFKKVKRQYPEKADVIRIKLQDLAILEKENCDSLDKTSNLFGEILGTMLTFKQDEFEDSLYKIGFNLGKFIYILDAYDDLPDDLKKNRFNPLKSFPQDTLMENIKQMLFLILDIISEEIDKLSVKCNKDIIDNIMFSGIYFRTINILNRTPKKELKHIQK